MLAGAMTLDYMNHRDYVPVMISMASPREHHRCALNLHLPQYGARLLCERGAGSGERGAGILRAWSRNYCPSLINIKIPLEIEI
jgi:hypothetical protein